MARALVDDVIAVSEEEIVAAMRLCFERMKVRLPRMTQCVGELRQSGLQAVVAAQ